MSCVPQQCMHQRSQLQNVLDQSTVSVASVGQSFDSCTTEMKQLKCLIAKACSVHPLQLPIMLCCIRAHLSIGMLLHASLHVCSVFLHCLHGNYFRSLGKAHWSSILVCGSVFLSGYYNRTQCSSPCVHIRTAKLLH